MSALTMAKSECANYCPDGGCLGIPTECLVSERGGKKVSLAAAPLAQCKLADSKGTCHYFEAAVLPLVHYWPQHYAGAIQEYKHRTNRQIADATLRLCECGQPLAKRHRYCDACSLRKRRVAARNGMNNIRQTHVSS